MVSYSQSQDFNNIPLAFQASYYSLIKGLNLVDWEQLYSSVSVCEHLSRTILMVEI